MQSLFAPEPMGFSYAAQLLGIEVIAHVENDPIFYEHYKRHWPRSRIFSDLRTVTAKDLGAADIIFGGEPCQPHSKAGKRKGVDDDRYLWPDYFRIVKAGRPRWVVNENVTGSVSNLALDTKITDLESEGYTTRAFNIPAVGVGAYHERQRIWLVAHADGERFSFNADIIRKQRPTAGYEELLPQGNCQKINDTFEPGHSNEIQLPDYLCTTQLPDDVPRELAEIKAFGNAVVPWIPYILLSSILQIESER